MNRHVEVKEDTEAPGGVAHRFVRESLPVPELEPDAFLRAASGRARGFWDRGLGWVAHVGEVASIAVTSSGTTRPHSRFEEVRRLGASVRYEAADGPPLRFYGGFSFRDDHRCEGMWEGFPAARFALPEVELESGPAGRFLGALAPVEGEASEEETRAGLRIYLQGLKSRLIEARDRAIERPAPQPATRVESDRRLWEEAVDEVLEAIRAGEVSKVVLARTLDVTTPRPLDPLEVLGHLREGNPGAHVFFFEPEPGLVLLGAAPETVATLRRGAFEATAVAGSAPVGRTPDLQEFWAKELLESEKDRAEHSYTVQDMVERLRPLTEAVTVDEEPHVLALRLIQHLETNIRASVATDCHVLELLEALHPTPAVCGYPRDAALDVLAREEPFDRGWYAGPVGWFDLGGNGVFVPALRCAVSRAGAWRLFAGAGIVPGSVAGLEWKETAIKFEPVLQALAASGAQ